MKNAFLIAAYDNYDQLRLLLRALDNPNNDIFVHINLLVKTPSIEILNESLSFSKLYFTDRCKIVWGKIGVLQSSLIMLKYASSVGKYDYYHFLSGSDFPIKTMNELNAFLIQNLYNNCSKVYKTNYIISKKTDRPCDLERVCKYNIGIRFYRSNNLFVHRLIRGINRLSLLIQSAFHISRIDKDKVYMGSSFWTISDEFASFVISQSDKILNLYKNGTMGADEFALQTLIMNSKFKNTLFYSKNNSIDGNLTLIDFKNGNGKGSPHIFTSSEYSRISNSSNFFVRKVDLRVDSNLVNKLFHNVVADKN